MNVTLTVNGTSRTVEVEPRTTLLDCLRDNLGLTGAHAGCEHGVCGACTVLLDGMAARSCLMFAVQADGIAITTIEGLSPGPGELSILQDAFCETHGTPVRLLHAGHDPRGPHAPAGRGSWPLGSGRTGVPWVSQNASCRIDNSPGPDERPSMVVIAMPSACTATSGTRARRLPSSSTVQAPHTPCSQPACAPVSPRLSRRQSSSVVRGSTSTVRLVPLTVRVTFMPGAPRTRWHAHPAMARCAKVARRRGGDNRPTRGCRSRSRFPPAAS